MAIVNNATPLADPRKRWLSPTSQNWQNSVYNKYYKPPAGITPPQQQGGQQPFWNDDGTRYIPTGKPDQWQEMGVKTPQSGVDPNNFLGNWDYQNPPTDPNTGRPLDFQGNPLPEGATAFTPYGEPDFTPADRQDPAALFEGWFKGIQYRLYKDVNLTEEGKNPFTASAKKTAGLLKSGQWGEGLKSSWDTLMQIGPGIRAIGADDTATDPTAATLASRTVAEVGRGIGSAFNLFSKTAESLIGTAYMTGQQAQEGSPLPDINFPDWVPGWAEVLAKGVGPLAGYGALRALTAPKKSWDTAIDQIDENWQASRIAFSVINDDNLKDEYIRRYKAGEDPRYLAMELENPMDELVGQLIFDPLNVAGFFTKTGALARRLDNLSDIYLKPAGAVDDAFKALRANTIQDGAKSLTNLAQAVQTEMKAVAQNLDNLSQNRGLLQLTTTGKRADLVNRSGQMIRFVFANTRKANGAYDFDKAMETMRALVNMADLNNLDNVAAAVTDVVKGTQVPRPLFSRAGMEMGITLRSMFEEVGGVADQLPGMGRGLDYTKFLRGFEEAQAGGIDSVVQWATNKLDTASKGLFPTVLEQAAAADRLAEFKKTGQIVLAQGETLADVQKAARAGQVSELAQMVARFDVATKGKIYAPINRFFANVYMGMSPGFAFRNLMNNALTIAVDAGPGSIFVGKDKALTGVKSLLGGVYNPKATLGVGIQGGIEGAAEAGKGNQWWNKINGLTLSAGFEETGAAQVSYKAVKDAMRRVLQPGKALPDITPLVNAGMNPESANLLSRLVVEFDGNVNQALARFRQLAAPGNIELTKTLGWLADDDIRIAQSFNLDGQLKTILTGDLSLSEKQAALQDLIANAEKFSDAAKHEMTGVTDMLQQGEGRDVAVTATNAVADGLMNDAEGAIVNHRIWSNAYTRRAYEELILAVREQGWEVLRKTNPELAETIPTTLKPIQDKMTGIWAVANSDHDVFTKQVWARTKELKTGKGKASLSQLWDEFKLEGDLPANLNVSEFLDTLWNHWRNTTRTRFATAREAYVSLGEAGWQEVQKLTGYEPSKALLDQAHEYLRTARAYDDALVETTSQGPLVFQKKDMILSALGREDNAQALRILADHYGIPTATSKGKPLDQVLLSVLKKYGNETSDLTNTTLDEAWKAFEAQRIAKGKGSLIGDLDEYLGRATDEAGAVITPKIKPASLATPYMDGSMPTGPRATSENLAGLKDWLNGLSGRLGQNSGKLTPVDFTDEVEDALTTWAKGANEGVAEGRLLASTYADAMRDFALHDYSKKRNLDLLAAYLMPYEFWYTRTYKNWLTRLVSDPAIIAAYAKYRTAMEKLHAGAPDWWKYNVNSNELLGRNDDNPLFFNLEATLNPLNGITGVDFNDPAKRVDWLTRSVDDLGKFGPTLWAPINLALAVSLHAKGEEDAAARWAGRLFPQSAQIRTIANLFNTNLEVDPYVQFFSDGQDPYEKKRAATALASLAQGVMIDGQWVQITDEQALDAANPTIRKNNPEAQAIWDQATSYALDQRTLGTLSSYFLGVGFKGRNVSELQVDRMYADYYKLWNTASMQSPDEFREQMEQLHITYPWMDAVILAKKAGPEVDRALAYNALGRIPPGQSKDVLGLFGLTEEMMQQFYDNKGDLSTMVATDRARFMSGIIDLSAALALPDGANRLEWAQVRTDYNAMQEQGKAQFGAEIWNRVSDFFALQKDNPEAAKLMIANNPKVQAALEFREQAVMDNPLLFDYYGGLDFLGNYWEGQMYEAAEKQFGAAIFELSGQYGALSDQEDQLLQQYYDMKDAGDPNAKAFYAAWLDKDSNQKDLFLAEHPELKAYWQLKEDYQEEIQKRLVEFEPLLRDVTPELREDYQPEGVYEIPAAAELGYEFQPEPTWSEWQQTLTPSQESLLRDYFVGGNLSQSMRTSLERMADEMDLSLEDLLSQMESSFYGSQVPVQ